MPDELELIIRLIDRDKEGWECADIMASTDPWITHGATREKTIRPVTSPHFETYVAVANGEIAGVIILAIAVPLIRGYIAGLAIKPAWRNRGIGTRLIQFAEELILRDSPNVFLCVSSFNTDAQRLYARLGYERVGELKNYVINGASEFLLRKTTGPTSTFVKKD
jgi:ribosomal protein S18 acetylase RimI-like enzyme